jgi:hypothetical protein
MVINYISVAVLLISYYYLFRLYEKRKITELSTINFRELPGGFILGFHNIIRDNFLCWDIIHISISNFLLY